MPAEALYGVGVDAGSARTRAVILRLERDRIRLLGWGEAASRGWKRGRIEDQGQVSECVLAAVRAAEQQAGISAASLAIGVGGPSICGANSRGGTDMSFPRQIDQNDINRAVDRASRVQLQEDETLLHLFPQDFKVDGRTGHRNPRGVIGSHLEVYVHLVTASMQEHNGLIGAANAAHFAVEETVFEPVAAAYAAVLPEEREEGVAVVDIGAHSTDMAVYFGEALALSASLPICGHHFTKDVARGLLIGLDDAELIKEQHGCALLGLTHDASLLELPSSAGRAARETTRHELNEILEARAYELFEFVEHQLAEAGMEDSLTSVVLCGGGARLAGMCDVAERVLHCLARNGLPVGILDWPAEIDNPAWTTAAGLAMYSIRLKLRNNRTQNKGGVIGRILGG